MAVDGERGVGFVSAEQSLDRLARRAQARDRRASAPGRPARSPRRAARLLRWRNGTSRLSARCRIISAARRRAARFDEAEVAGRDFRLASEVELAEASALAPVPDLLADGEELRLHEVEE